jgi:hypothetical protein
MNIQSLQNNISRIDKDIAGSEKQLADEEKKELDKTKQYNRIEKSINKNTSLNTLKSRQNQLIRIQGEITKISKKKSEISNKIANKKSQKTRYQKQLDREIKAEQKRKDREDRKRRQEEIRHQQQITSEIQQQKQLQQEQDEVLNDSNQIKYDFFISHASEDKEDFVRPLADKLNKLGLKIWYDDFQLKVGDSLRRSIDNGLKNSKFGIVVLSSAFFSKNWPQYELDGLVAKEMRGMKVILPIWHKVSKDEVMSYSPTLGDKVALNSSMMSIDEIADELKEIVEE